MRNPKHSSTENLHRFLKLIFDAYTVELREEYPGRRIRNAAVREAGIPAFERLGYIELVDGRVGIRKGIPECFIDRIKRANRQRIWLPSRNFPLNLFDLSNEMRPYLWDDGIFWRHTPSECLRIGQIQNTTLIEERFEHARFMLLCRGDCWRDLSRQGGRGDQEPRSGSETNELAANSRT